MGKRQDWRTAFCMPLVPKEAPREFQTASDLSQSQKLHG
jgi:hypothetical protein